MAFQRRGRPWKCGKCHGRFKHYDMYESQRPNAVDHLEDGDTCWRVCAGCEMDLRQDEWGSWPDADRACRGSDYLAARAINQYFKRNINERHGASKATMPSSRSRR